MPSRRATSTRKIDFEEEPPYYQVSETHFAKTWLLDPLAPEAEPPEAVKTMRERGKRQSALTSEAKQ